MKTLILAALLTTSTQRVEPPCVTTAEVADMVLFVMPAMIEGTAQKCRGSLPAGAYLFNGAHSLAERLDAERKLRYPQALAAFEKMAGEKMPKGITQETLARLMSEGISGEVLGGLKTSMCADINEAAELLAPLPPENLGGLVSMLARLGLKGEAKRSKAPNICAVER